MSKPISFGFGKVKVSAKPVVKQFKPSALATNVDHEDEQPKHEQIDGFTASGAITSAQSSSARESNVKVIENGGNQDWRTRGRPPPSRAIATPVLVEKDEVSKASGLQFAATTAQSTPDLASTTQSAQPTVPQSLEQQAVTALLNGENRVKSTAIIASSSNANTNRLRSEADDFKADVSSRPDSASLADYAAMPIEDFGLAMLRGMGKKRRANGEVINLDTPKEDSSTKRKQEGYLGIGAKAPKGIEIAELGAWGKADMRRNNKGEGFFTPVMVKLASGEVISEEELERRKGEAAKGRSGTKEDRHMRNGHSGRNSDIDYAHRSRHHRSRSRDRHRRGDRDRERVRSRSPRHR